MEGRTAGRCVFDGGAERKGSDLCRRGRRPGIKSADGSLRSTVCAASRFCWSFCTTAFTVSSGTVHDGLYRAATFGWVGVDLFFVLSGFLITGILCDTRHDPTTSGIFSSDARYASFPSITSALLLLLCLPFINAQAGDDLRRHQAWYWAYLVNIFESLHPFAPSVTRTGHFWSLAVEEQFYVFWPFVVLLLKPRRLRWVCLAAIAAAPLLRAVLLFRLALDPMWVYTFLPTRVDALMVGALLAIAARDAGDHGAARALAREAGWAMALVVVGTIAYRDRSFVFHTRSVQLLGYSAICVLGGAMVAGLTWSSQTSWLKRACETRCAAVVRALQLRRLRDPFSIDVPAARPLDAGLRSDAHGAEHGVRGACCSRRSASAATSGLAYASWFVIEQPFLRMKRFFDYGSGSLSPGRARANEQAASGPLVSGGALGLPGLGESTISEPTERPTHEGRDPE